MMRQCKTCCTLMDLWLWRLMLHHCNHTLVELSTHHAQPAVRVPEASTASNQTIVNYYELEINILIKKKFSCYFFVFIDSKNTASYNHAVNIVGYVTTGTSVPYYILRNSWGTNWGEVREFLKTQVVVSLLEL